MIAAESLASTEAAGERLSEVERLLTASESAEQLTVAVARLEEACRKWPGLMACVTDRKAWESLSRQIRRLELLAAQGIEATQMWESLSGTVRGYTKSGDLAEEPAAPANVNCRG